MRTRLAAVLLCSMMLGSTTLASAAPIEVVHEAPIACSVACPYWDAGEFGGYDVCAAPYPQGSYDETYFSFTGEGGAGWVEVLARPEVDYDIFACAASDPPVLVTSGNSMPYPCEGLGVPFLQVGCTEGIELLASTVLEASGGTTTDFFLRSYNWLDPGSSRVSVSGPVVVTDDSFCGYPVASFCY